MSTDRDFPQSLVDERARELYEARMAFGWPGWDSLPERDKSEWRRAARLSLTREREACAPLVEALEDILQAAGGEYRFDRPDRFVTILKSRLRNSDFILAAHRARYAPEPPKPTLAEAVERYLNASTWTGEALESLREALARERATAQDAKEGGR